MSVPDGLHLVQNLWAWSSARSEKGWPPTGLLVAGPVSLGLPQQARPACKIWVSVATVQETGKASALIGESHDTRQYCRAAGRRERDMVDVALVVVAVAVVVVALFAAVAIWSWRRHKETECWDQTRYDAVR